MKATVEYNSKDLEELIRNDAQSRGHRVVKINLKSMPSQAELTGPTISAEVEVEVNVQ